VHPIDMAIPPPYPGSERRRPPTETAIGGLYLAGDWVQTGLPSSMEGGLFAPSGWRPSRLLKAAGRLRQMALEPPKAEGVVRLLGE
jgi:hypothetical protein